MKKRSMLAIASLATGFVVAAVTPSHAEDHTVLDDLNVKDTISAVDRTVSQDSFAMDEHSLGQNG
ncbi:hypothetical protein ACIQKE_23450 [Streptomyces griseoviridis]|uniref:Secreted protein n=1 Tax=Streptomyces hintoniae TaxID=3075521 RepID=A0ABU2UJ28_9ACTN|nr:MULTISPECIES: hypothetical protein [unclassified Streptomyces]MDH6697638.1 hypothetical protein [Streptomyces sp. MAA16]MDT0473094.1 hypothetical protein [Streptomyces sp. DSM 41014]